MNNIEEISIVKRENLDEKNYFNTIISEAYKFNLLNDEDMTNLQFQVLELLDKIVYKYNGIDSSSIRKEVLEDISYSNIYTISVYLKTFKNPDKAIKEIKEKGIVYVYEKGHKELYKILNVIRVMYIKVKQNRINVENDTYDETLLKGIQGFLKIYNLDFKAQDMKITADYPLYNNIIGKLEGAEFIKEYLNSIYLENEFCKKFEEQKIKYLLYAHSKSYKELVINIFEIVLLEVLACKLVKKNVQDLTISKDELNKIYLMFNEKSSEGINNIIENVYNELKSDLLFDNIELQKYIEKNLDNIKSIIRNSLKNNTLERIFITQKFLNIS